MPCERDRCGSNRITVNWWSLWQLCFLILGRILVPILIVDNHYVSRELHRIDIKTACTDVFMMVQATRTLIARFWLVARNRAMFKLITIERLQNNLMLKFGILLHSLRILPLYFEKITEWQSHILGAQTKKNFSSNRTASKMVLPYKKLHCTLMLCSIKAVEQLSWSGQ